MPVLQTIVVNWSIKLMQFVTKPWKPLICLLGFNTQYSNDYHLFKILFTAFLEWIDVVCYLLIQSKILKAVKMT